VTAIAMIVLSVALIAFMLFFIWAEHEGRVRQS